MMTRYEATTVVRVVGVASSGDASHRFPGVGNLVAKAMGRLEAEAV